MDIPKAGLQFSGQKTCFQVGKIEVGKDFLLIAGPCSVEGEAQIFQAAEAVCAAGANILRGGAYKPRTSPYSFQGLGQRGVELLCRAGRAVGLPVVSEVIDTRDVGWMSEQVDILQIGARNMCNYALLREVGKSGCPVLLKRGMEATLEEWLSSAEYILQAGNARVILCERGIRSFDHYTRNLLDVSSLAALKRLTHLPVIADPSHATGRAELVPDMSLAAIMSGCDGLEIEVHPCPGQALSDARQQLSPEQFARLAENIRRTWYFRENQLDR